MTEASAPEGEVPDDEGRRGDRGTAGGPDDRDGVDGHVRGTGGDGDLPPADPGGYDVPDPESREFGRRGWALVAALVVALVVIPWTIIAIPQAQSLLEALPLGYRDAYLVLPFVPAVFLGLLGVWTAVANRRP
ncbi:hypothetical protein [Halosimplex halophilum]|uniref:hypothetical protein n=1 Tax=Halosimplex halophilum TaxID=2559572 RepID=UPI001FEBDD06|nr:hypothetical protein [Halosimplex halophilum]